MTVSDQLSELCRLSREGQAPEALERALDLGDRTGWIAAEFAEQPSHLAALAFLVFNCGVEARSRTCHRLFQAGVLQRLLQPLPAGSPDTAAAAEKARVFLAFALLKRHQQAVEWALSDPQVMALLQQQAAAGSCTAWACLDNCLHVAASTGCAALPLQALHECVARQVPRTTEGPPTIHAWKVLARLVTLEPPAPDSALYLQVAALAADNRSPGAAAVCAQLKPPTSSKVAEGLALTLLHSVATLVPPVTLEACAQAHRGLLGLGQAGHCNALVNALTRVRFQPGRPWGVGHRLVERVLVTCWGTMEPPEAWRLVASLLDMGTPSARLAKHCVATFSAGGEEAWATACTCLLRLHMAKCPDAALALVRALGGFPMGLALRVAENLAKGLVCSPGGAGRPTVSGLKPRPPVALYRAVLHQLRSPEQCKRLKPLLHSDHWGVRERRTLLLAYQNVIHPAAAASPVPALSPHTEL